MIKINGTEFTTLLLGLKVSADGKQFSARTFIDADDVGRVVRIHRINGIDGQDILAVPQLGIVAYIVNDEVDLSTIDEDEFTDCIVEVVKSIGWMQMLNVDFSQILQEEDEDGYLLTDESLVQARLEERAKKGNSADSEIDDPLSPLTR